MGEPNKRYNRKIWRACPVCKGRVVLGYRNQNWWVSCEYDASHIPQKFFPHPSEAIEEWNVKGNKETNADRIRSMTDVELAEKMSGLESFALTCGGGWPPEKWLDWLRQEANDVGQ